MHLTVDQIVALAPDEKSAAAGKKLGSASPWKNTGCSDIALWGECQGSAVYQVRIDLRELAYRCSCPSRKLPCKHVLGLLLLAANSPQAIGRKDAPEWVGSWLDQRAERAQKREEKAAEPAKPVDAAAQAKRAQQRAQRVAAGLDRLDLWLGDLIRNGLAAADVGDPAAWEAQAKRLVDAQAPALAARLRRMGEIPRSTPDWPQRLLAELGRLALLSHAYRRVDSLDAPLQADVRQMLGWTVGKEELAASGETVADRWLVLGQWIEEEDRVRVQRNWLLGQTTARSAYVLQFSAGGQPFEESILPGAGMEGELVYWPGAVPQRAKFAARGGAVDQIVGPLPAAQSIEAFLATTAEALGRQPWLDRFLCVLEGATPIPAGDPSAAWSVADRDGNALKLTRREHWQLLAISGGRPLTLAAEWDGAALMPLGVFRDGQYHLLAVS